MFLGHDNGDLVQWDVKAQNKLKVVSVHGKSIADIQSSRDEKMFITASKVIVNS